jgi:hypothetical protein
MTATLDQLQQRCAEIDAAIGRADNEFADLAGAFDTGSKSALAKAEQIEQKVNALRRERELNLLAQSQIEKQQQAEATAAEQEAKRKLQVEARTQADAAATFNQRIDESLRALVDLIAQRNNSLRALIATGEGNADWLNKLLGKPSLTRACCHFGLHRFADLVTVSPSSHAPLASANPILLGIGIAPEPPPASVERRKLRNGTT